MMLSHCPQCGAKAYIKRDAPDGFFMGYSVGCPRYKKSDGIHTKKMAYRYIGDKERAVKFWNFFCEKEEKGEKEWERDTSHHRRYALSVTEWQENQE